MKKIIVLTVLLLLCFQKAMPQDRLSILWQKGNDFYKSKIYDSAAFCYEQIASLKPKNADVYYNLGNTYYRLNKIGHAVLNFERALKINPNFKEAKDNLMLTQNRISNHIMQAGDIFFINWWNSITRTDKATTWSVTALVVFILAVVILLIKKINRNLGEKIPVQSIYILGFAWMFFMVIAFITSKKGIEANSAVVMQNETPLMNTDLKGKPITQLPEGTTVSIIEEKEMWIEVRIPDGRVGLIQNNLIEKI